MRLGHAAGHEGGQGQLLEDHPVFRFPLLEQVFADSMDRHVEDAQGIRLIGVERFLVRGGPARVGGIAGLEGVGPLAATLDFPQAVQGMVSGRDIEPVAKSPLDRGPVRQDVPLDHLQEEALREVVGLVFPDERHQADQRAGSARNTPPGTCPRTGRIRRRSIGTWEDPPDGLIHHLRASTATVRTEYRYR